MKIAFVTNICPHYRVKTFESLALHYDIDYYFFSAGDDWYWQHQHGVHSGNFHNEYLPGFRVGKTRISAALPLKLWRGEYSAFIKCINGRFALPITYMVARLQRKPFILWTGIWMRLQTPAHRFFFPITRFIYNHSDAIVVYGEHVKQYLAGEGVPLERIFIASHATDTATYNRVVSEREKAALLQKLQIASNQKVVLYLGRLEEIKGLPYLLQAFAKTHNNAVLVIAGDGSQLQSLKQLAQELGIVERVRFTGYVPTEETIPFYAISWVYVLPSITKPYFKEPWGLTVNEAFHQGVPVIATDAVGAAAGGLVQNKVNGFIVPERDSQGLADALKEILEAPNLRTCFGERAHKTIASWDNERMVRGFRDALDYALRKM